MTAPLRLLPPRAVAPLPAEQWTEEQIKELAVNNRRAAMELIIRRHRDRLFWHASSIVKDSQEAYDLVQEVFIRAMREPRFFDEEFRMKAWLFRVTSNLCFNNVRDRRRRGAILEATPFEDRAQADQLDTLFHGEQRGEVLRAIEEMTQDHREILVLRYYDDLSYAEIAEVLDVKLGTVMSRLSRARARILEVMRQQGSLPREA
jgi:RNA polymerase sigma-70 factor (ECF subfamily)